MSKVSWFAGYVQAKKKQSNGCKICIFCEFYTQKMKNSAKYAQISKCKKKFLWKHFKVYYGDFNQIKTRIKFWLTCNAWTTTFRKSHIEEIYYVYSKIRIRFKTNCDLTSLILAQILHLFQNVFSYSVIIILLHNFNIL